MLGSHSEIQGKATRMARRTTSAHMNGITPLDTVPVDTSGTGVGKSRLFYEFSHSHRTKDWLVVEKRARIDRAAPWSFVGTSRPPPVRASRSSWGSGGLFRITYEGSRNPWRCRRRGLGVHTRLPAFVIPEDLAREGASRAPI